MARRAYKSTSAIVYSCAGLAMSSACFFAAMAVSFGDVTRGKAIARLVLWSMGLTFDFTGLVLSSSTSKAIFYELEYWTERHAAVVLIVLGEGGELRIHPRGPTHPNTNPDFTVETFLLVIGLFENFRSVYTGPATGFRASFIGQIFAAVGIFRIIYCI